jgi:hypothetical protein
MATSTVAGAVAADAGAVGAATVAAAAGTSIPLLGGIMYVPRAPAVCRGGSVPRRRLTHRAWRVAAFEQVDDRLRGGASRSRLTLADDGTHVVLSGHLDPDALGGAAFASQQVRGRWSAGGSEGVRVRLLAGDGRRYVLLVRDDAATYEAEMPGVPGDVWIAWSAFRPVRRGRSVVAGPLDPRRLRVLGFMMRSFYGLQSGDFELSIAEVVAEVVAEGCGEGCGEGRGRGRRESEDEDESEGKVESKVEHNQDSQRPGWRSVVSCGLWRA